MFKKRFVPTVLFLLMVVMVVSPADAASKKFVRMFSGPEGGSWYPLGVAMMQIAEKLM